MTLLPSGWREVPLSSVAEVRLGRQRSPKNHLGEQMRPYVRAANVDWSGLRLDDIKFMNFSDSELSTYRLEPGDLLLGEASGSPHEVGKPAIWRGEIYDCAFQNTLIRVRPMGPDPEYLLHYFRHQALTGRFAAAARGVGIRHLGSDALAKWRLPLPPLAEQRRIAEVLDRSNALRAKRREALALLDDLTQSIFLDMFGSWAQMRQRWRIARLVDVCLPEGGIKCGPFGTQLAKSEFRKEGVPLWGIKDVNCSFRLLAREFVDACTAERLEQFSIIPGDIIMTRKGTVGNCAVYPDAYPAGLMHSDLLRLRPKLDNVDVTFFAFQLQHSSDIAWQLSLISGGAVMPGVNVSRLSGLEVVVPPMAHQVMFADRAKGVALQRDHQLAADIDNASLLASLQQRAFSGQL